MEKMTKKEKKEAKRFEYQEKLKKQKQMDMIKRFGIWGGAGLILALSVWGLFALSTSTTSNSSDSQNAPAISADDITIGSPSAKVTLTEYSDFQCPACAAYHPIVNQLMNEFTGKMLFAYRFFPLTQVHKNGQISAQAGWAAQQQGKFEDMYNMLFDTQNDWSNVDNAEEIFIGYAGKLGLDTNKFKIDMNSDEAKKAVNDDYAEGVGIGINSTPTFYLNGKKILNPRTFDDFKGLIQNEIDKK